VPTRMGTFYSTPSGLNAHWTAASLAGEFARLRAAASAWG
jgi:hypothetical protein